MINSRSNVSGQLVRDDDRYLRWKGWAPESFGAFRPDEAHYFDCELRRSGIAVIAGKKVGELGFGNGAFAGWIRSNGGTWVGKEVSDELANRALRAGYSVVMADQEFSSVCGCASLHLIVAFDVVEHLDTEHIREVFSDAARALVEGGSFVFRLPSGDSPFSAAIYNGDVTHKSLLGSAAIRRLAAEAELEVHQIRQPAMPTFELGLTTGLRRIAVNAVQRLAFRFISGVLMANRDAVISPNMLVVLKKPTARE